MQSDRENLPDAAPPTISEMKKARKKRLATIQKRPLTSPALRKRLPTLRRRPPTQRPATQLFARFPDEASARAWFERLRWEQDRWCPACFSQRTTPVPQAIPMPYRCKDCRRYFSVRTGTVMQSSRLPLRTWAVGLSLLSTSSTGVSSRKLHRALGIAQSNAWSLGRRIRTAWQDYVALFERRVAGDDTTTRVPALPADPKALARALFWVHDRKRWTRGGKPHTRPS